MAEKKNTKKSPKSASLDSKSVSPKKNIVSEVKTERCSENCCSKNSVLKKHLFFLLGLVILAVFLGYFFRDRLLVAIVDGKPISRYKLNQLLMQGSGKDALESLIVEDLIKNEVKKNRIVVSEEEVDGEVKKISEQFGDEAKFEEVLTAQGMTLEDFRSQLETKLQVYQILGKDIVVSDEEISQFITENGQSLTATTEEEKRTEASGILKEQKINEKIQAWISGLLEKAKITRFLE